MNIKRRILHLLISIIIINMVIIIFIIIIIIIIVVVVVVCNLLIWNKCFLAEWYQQTSWRIAMGKISALRRWTFVLILLILQQLNFYSLLLNVRKQRHNTRLTLPLCYRLTIQISFARFEEDQGLFMKYVYRHKSILNTPNFFLEPGG